MSQKKHISFDDGSNLCIRKLKPNDREMVRSYFSDLSSHTKYNRYFRHKDELTEQELEDCVAQNPDEHYVIGAWECSDSQEETLLVGTASYIRLNDANESAEFAIIVADAWQNKGVGKHLMRAVIESAKEADIEHMLVYFLASNTGMKKLTQSMGENVSFNMEEGAIVADIHLDKDEVNMFFWPGELADIWDNIFQSVIDMSFMPFTIYLHMTEESQDMMNSMINFDRFSDFEEWLDSLEDAWF